MLYHQLDCGPTFSSDLRIGNGGNDFNSEGSCYSNLGYTYNLPNGMTYGTK